MPKKSFGFNDSGDAAQKKKKMKKKKEQEEDEDGDGVEEVNDGDEGMSEASAGTCDNERDAAAEEGVVGVLEKLRHSTVPQVASMFHQEWIDDAAAIFLISGNVVRKLVHDQ